MDMWWDQMPPSHCSFSSTHTRTLEGISWRTRPSPALTDSLEHPLCKQSKSGEATSDRTMQRHTLNEPGSSVAATRDDWWQPREKGGEARAPRESSKVTLKLCGELSLQRPSRSMGGGGNPDSSLSLLFLLKRSHLLQSHNLVWNHTVRTTGTLPTKHSLAHTCHHRNKCLYHACIHGAEEPRHRPTWVITNNLWLSVLWLYTRYTQS